MVRRAPVVNIDHPSGDEPGAVRADQRSDRIVFDHGLPARRSRDTRSHPRSPRQLLRMRRPEPARRHLLRRVPPLLHPRAPHRPGRSTPSFFLSRSICPRDISSSAAALVSSHPVASSASRTWGSLRTGSAFGRPPRLAPPELQLKLTADAEERRALRRRRYRGRRRSAWARRARRSGRKAVLRKQVSPDTRRPVQASEATT
jgi:hypothetical protein